MDTPELCQLLDVEPYGTFKISDLLQIDWGAELIFECVYEFPTPRPPLYFRLHLRDCRDMRWRVYAYLRHPEDLNTAIATLVNVRLGQGQHRKPLHLLTDFFGFSVSYGELVVEKDL
jgi:hypothetical protein